MELIRLRRQQQKDNDTARSKMSKKLKEMEDHKTVSNKTFKNYAEQQRHAAKLSIPRARIDKLSNEMEESKTFNKQKSPPKQNLTVAERLARARNQNNNSIPNKSVVLSKSVKLKDFNTTTGSKLKVNDKKKKKRYLQQKKTNHSSSSINEDLCIPLRKSKKSEKKNSKKKQLKFISNHPKSTSKTIESNPSTKSNCSSEILGFHDDESSYIVSNLSIEMEESKLEEIETLRNVEKVNDHAELFLFKIQLEETTSNLEEEIKTRATALNILCNLIEDNKNIDFSKQMEKIKAFQSQIVCCL